MPIPCYKPKGNWDFVWVCYCFAFFVQRIKKPLVTFFRNARSWNLLGLFSILAETSTLIIGARKSALLIFFADNVARLS